MTNGRGELLFLVIAD